jgi:hypothetical protein
MRQVVQLDMMNVNTKQLGIHEDSDTHTHTERERERERDGEGYLVFSRKLIAEEEIVRKHRDGEVK